MKFRPILFAAVLLIGTAVVANAGDDSRLSSVTVSPQVGALAYGGGGTATYTVTVTRKPGTSAFSSTLSQTATLPSGATVVSFNPPKVDFLASDVSKTSTLTISTAGSTRAGATTIKVKATASENYISANGTLAIGKAPLTVTAKDDSKVYNGKGYPGGKGVTYSGFVNGETPAVLGGTLTYDSHGAVNAGSHAITPGGQTSSNYAITFVDGTLTIEPAFATVKANSKTRAYGEANPPLDATVTGEVAGDPIHYTLSTVAGPLSNVAGSPYAIAVTLGSNPNYSVKVPADNGTLTVQPALATVKANSKTRAYGAPNPPLDATVTGEVPGGDPINYTLSTAGPLSPVAGSPYAITVTLGYNPNYSVKVPADNGTLTIHPAPATVTANDKSRAYGVENPVLDATVTGAVPGGDPINYTLATTATSLSNVLSSPYAITVTLGSNPNYAVTPANGALTINAAPATVKANSKTRAYGAPNPVLDATVTGEVPGGDPIQYTLTTAATPLSPVAGNPYAITVTLGSNPNYSVKVPADNGTLTISPAIATVTANNKSKTYGAPNPVLDATVTGEVTGGDAINFTLSTVATQFSGVTGGPYAISVALGSNPNYSVTPVNGTLAVQPALATVSLSNTTKFYGDPNPPLDGSATVKGAVAGGDPINFTVVHTATQCSPVAGSPYAYMVTQGSNPNYTITVIDGALTVQLRLVTVAANNKTKTYGEANPALGATVTNEAVGCDPINYTLATTATQFSSVAGSPYPINVTLGANPNYSVTLANGTLTIQLAPATVTANNKSKTYGAINPTLDATVKGQVTGGDPISYTLATTAEQYSSVGPYPITVTLGPNPNYGVTPTNGTLTIQQSIVTVTANNKKKTYGDPNPVLDATVSGAVTSEVLNSASLAIEGAGTGGDPINYTLSTTATQFSGVAGSPYTIKVTLGSNPNYSVTPADGALTISPVFATVKANDQAKTYGDPNPVPVATVTGQVVGGDPILYTLAHTATQFGSVAGSPYPINVTLGSNPNYSVKVPADNGKLTITPAFATVKANDQTKTYGSPNPEPLATVTGQVPGGDPILYTLAHTATQFSNVAGSPYPINVTLGSNPNYSVKVPADNGELTIEAAFATVKANDQTKTYGSPNPEPVATVTGQVPGGDPILYTLAHTATQFSSVAGSPYAINVTLGSNPNYSVKVPADNGKLTITPAFATVKANNQTKTYGSPNPEPVATVTGQVPGGDPILYTLTHTATQFSSVAGSPYPINVTLGSNPNYSVKVPADNGTLTVQPALASVTAHNKTKAYGEAVPVLTATVTGQVPGGDPINYSLSTAATSLSNVVGSPYVIKVTLGSNPNYIVTPADGALMITPAFATVKANNQTKSYGDLNPLPVATVTGEVTGGEPIHYTLTHTATQCSNVLGGPYAILVTLGSNPNYSVKVPADNGVLTVEPRLATVKANSKTRVYGDDNPVLDATVTGEAVGCEPIHYTLSTAATRCSNVLGGPYAILVTLGSNPNYSVKVPADNGVLTVEPRLATVKANSKTRAYGDDNPVLDATVTGEAVGCEPIHYTLSTAATRCSNVLDGPYAILVTLGSNPNYSVKVPADNGVLTVEPRLATVTVNSKSKIYGDANPALDATVTGEVACADAVKGVFAAAGGVAGGDPIKYTLDTPATQCSSVAGSPYVITVTLGSNPNYSVTVTNGALTVQPRPVTVTVKNKTKIYGDADPPIEVTVTNEAVGCDPVNYTFATVATGTQCRPVAGSPYTITATLGSNPNYSVTMISGLLTVLPRPATVAANNKTKTYGNPNPTLDATVTNEAVGCDPVLYTLLTTATELSGVGPYAITVTPGDNPNYTVTPANGTLTIQTRPVTATADAKTKVYGSDDPPLTYAITSGSLVSTDAFSGVLTRVPGETVAGSPYAILQGTLALSNDYAMTYVGANLAITPAPLTVTANHQSKVYGYDDPTLSYEVTGFQFTDDAPGVLTGGLTRVPGQTVAGSPYEIQQGTLAANTNYTIGFTGNTLEITTRPVTVTANARSKTFGSDDPELTYAITSGSRAYTDAFTGALERVSGESVAGGPYGILQGTLALNSNYVLSYVGASLTILQAQATTSLAFAPNPQQYSDVVVFTATVTNGYLGSQKALDAITVMAGLKTLGTIPLAPSGTSLTGTLSVALLDLPPAGAGPPAPGTYAVTAGEALVNPNFLVTLFDPSTLTISPEDARAAFTGAILASAGDGDDNSSSTTASSASKNSPEKGTVTLSATIRDITGTSDAAGDVSPGDVRNATVTFVDRDNGNAAIATVPIGLVSTGETMTGTATYEWPVNIGSANAKQFRVGIIVNNYYTRNSLVDNAVVTVSKPSACTITGDGFLALSSSSGILAGDAGTQNGFSFNLKRKNNESMKGSFTATLWSAGRKYQVEGSNVTSLSIQETSAGGTATLNGKATIRDITAGGSAVIDNNATLQVTMADLGQPGTSDAIAITVWNKKGGLWFASGWDGVRTVQKVIGGGNIKVSGKNGNGNGNSGQPTFASAGVSDPAAAPSGPAIPLSFGFPQNFPNPFTASTTLRFDLPEPSRVTLTIYDVMGREVANLVDRDVEPGYHVATWSGQNREGRPAAAGVYFARMVATSLKGSGGLRSNRRIVLAK